MPSSNLGSFPGSRSRLAATSPLLDSCGRRPRSRTPRRTGGPPRHRRQRREQARRRLGAFVSWRGSPRVVTLLLELLEAAPLTGRLVGFPKPEVSAAQQVVRLRQLRLEPDCLHQRVDGLPESFRPYVNLPGLDVRLGVVGLGSQGALEQPEGGRGVLVVAGEVGEVKEDERVLRLEAPRSFEGAARLLDVA